MQNTLRSECTDSISADIKLETENEEGICSEEAPACLSKNVYHPRVALKNAIADWLPEFYISKDAWGPITKPHPAVTSERCLNFRPIFCFAPNRNRNFFFFRLSIVKW